MKVTTTNILKLKLQGDEASDFKELIKTLSEGVVAIGFKNGSLSENQIKLLNTINKKINH
jgi:hypothetical protein